MKLFKIYMMASTLVVLASTVVFWKFISVNVASICPLFLVFLSLLQAMTFISSAKSAENGESETAYSAHNELTRDEQAALFRVHGLTKIAVLPMLLIFAIFFQSVYKIILPIVIYVASFLLARLVVIKTN